MPDLVKIPTASAVYQARFERPCLGLISADTVRAFDAVVTALAPFQFRLSDAEFVTTGTPADYKTIFRLPERGITFQFGAEEYRFTKDGAAWSSSDEDVAVLEAAQGALLSGIDVKVKSSSLALAMHVQPVAKAREEILKPFVSEPLTHLISDRKFQGFGTHLRWNGGEVLLDYSVAFANGIFLRLSSDFDGHPSLSDVLARARSDQEAIFGILGVEEAA